MKIPKFTSIVLVMVASALLASPILAATIRIEPHGSYFGLPVMLTSPATFYVNLTAGQSTNPTTDPHIFLVMTETSFNSLTGNVTVSWHDGTESVTITAWNMESVNAVKAPPGTTPGTGYTVAALKDHLNTTESIYWAFAPFLGGMNITHTAIPFTVTLPATEPCMAVYVLGKTIGSELFDNRNPPTQPGFVIPEPATIAAATLSIAALLGYVLVKRRR
jgi:hypothetical protein